MMKLRTRGLAAFVAIGALTAAVVTQTKYGGVDPSSELIEPAIYTRGIDGGDYFSGTVNPAILEVGQQVEALGYSVQYYQWFPERLDEALAYGAPLDLTWSPYHLKGHHPLDDPDGLKDYIAWCNDVLPQVAQKVPAPAAILLNTENLRTDQGSLFYHNLAYSLAKRYWPQTPAYWYGPHWAPWLFDSEVKTDAVSARLYWPWDLSRSQRDYQKAEDAATKRALKVVAYVSLGAGYGDNDEWTWCDPRKYEPDASRALAEFLRAQTTLEAVQFYPAPTDTENFLIHFEAFMEGWEGEFQE